MKIHVSNGNTKLGKIANWSLTPGRACPELACKTCLKNGCYAMKAYRMYPAVRKAWNENTEIAETDIQELRLQLLAFFKKYKGDFFRIHQAGDFIGTDYFEMWLEIAQLFPHIQFLAYTKAFDIIRFVSPQEVPRNLQIILSHWTGVSIPYNLDSYYRVAWLATSLSDSTNYDGYVCPGDCTKCKECYTNSLDTDIIFIKH